MEQSANKAVRIRLIKLGANVVFVALLLIDILVLNKYAIPLNAKKTEVLTWGYIPWWATLIIGVALFTGLLGVYYAISLHVKGLLEKKCDPIAYYLVSKGSVFKFTKEQQDLLEMQTSFYTGKFSVAIDKANCLLEKSRKNYDNAVKTLIQSYYFTEDLDANERLIKNLAEKQKAQNKKERKSAELFLQYALLYGEMTKGNYYKAKQLINCVVVSAKTPKNKKRYEKNHRLAVIEWEYMWGLIQLKTGYTHNGKATLKDVTQKANKTFYFEKAKSLLEE